MVSEAMVAGGSRKDRRKMMQKLCERGGMGKNKDVAQLGEWVGWDETGFFIAKTARVSPLSGSLSSLPPVLLNRCFDLGR